ncbi:tRNA pseudouridine synthase Pus10 [Parasteatoda tepidariorum]|uniref:tRNA pseudouridine synthase Pus10 n=1 Tax=Parasteatoda tepidariorum TaxID=114398 RepID=UPI00077FC6CF|nr:tRNA pseudouridine synthase Pus10 isoform X1 [Parasteatoda tepidariorum]
MVKHLMYRSIRDVLDGSDVCRRCLLRFFGVKHYSSYLKNNVEETIKKYLEETDTSLLHEESIDLQSLGNVSLSPEHKRALVTPCAACLGVLQDVDNMVSRVEAAVNESKHKFQNFVLQISLPAIIDLRDKLFLLYLQEKIGDCFTFGSNDIPTVKDICKWVIGSMYGEMTEREFTPFSEFQIFLSASYPQTVTECQILFEKCPEAFPNAKKRVPKENVYNRTAVLKAIDKLSSTIKKLYTLPPSAPDKSLTFSEIRCTHAPLYLGGRYNKYSRVLSQTPWIVDGERHMESSVSELITDIVEKHIQADKIVFSASGREDVDVKMLGNGRPFILELINPRNVLFSRDEIKAIEDDVNQNTDLIAVKNLQVISKEDTSILKEGEEEKRKTYSALCVVKKTLKQEDVDHLEGLEDVKLNQKTPIRVLHRRTLSIRERLIHSIKGKIIDDHHLLLRLETQAGTYVKEFVHSDFGRTTPSLGTLLETEADILELDVESIHLDWPPESSSDFKRNYLFV